MRLNDLLQVIDVVNEDSVQVIQPWVDVARNRNVDEEHWAILAGLQKLLAMLLAKDGMRRARRANDNVRPRSCVIQAFKGNCLPFEFVGQSDSAVIGAIRNENLIGAVSEQMSR